LDFELTEDHVALRDAVRDVAGKECTAALVRAVAEGRGAEEVDALWRTYAALDWPGLALPVEVGGVGLTTVELVLALEELGRVADPTPMLATSSQYAPLVLAAGDDAQRAALLGVVASGGSGTVALDGTVRAEPAADGWRLTGTLDHVLDGARADEVAVVGRTPDGPRLFVVPGSAVTAHPTTTFDATTPVASVALDAVAVGADRALAGDAADALARAREVAVTGLAASTVGASQRILDLVVDHVRHRHQFGVPIGSFQAVKHMAVDVHVAVERARALVHFAALTIAEDDPRRTVAASMAKAASGDAQRIAVRHGIQLFGGLGFTWENDLQLFVRRAKAGELLLGSTHHHRRRVATAALAASREGIA
jgi:alkylation response protein AidB-like acyl-CoA dehydrogenase